MSVEIPDDIWCVSCGEGRRANGLTLCLDCAGVEIVDADIPWIVSPDGQALTEAESVEEAKRILGINRAYLRRQIQAEKKGGRGYTKKRHKRSKR